MSKHKICEQCGKDFVGYGVRFCSQVCSKLGNWKNYVYKRKSLICLNCKTEFFVKNKEFRGRKYCSNKCRKDYQGIHGTPKRFYPKECHAGKWYTKYFNLKRRAVEKGLDCLTSREFVKWYQSQPKICFYCGIPAEVWERVYKNSQFKFDLTIDRKDVGQGYLEYNMALCCGHCNVVKNNILTEKEMLEIGEKYMKPKWQKRIQEVNASA